MAESKQTKRRDLMSNIRKEMDSLGEVDVAADMLWGAQTQRSLEHFSIGKDLMPREFQLLKYMMRRSDQVLTRADLLRDVWHYKFVPETNFVDVHMGRLRCKVDGSNDVPMIRNIRGEGFLLSATPVLAKSLPGLRGLNQRADSNKF